MKLTGERPVEGQTPDSLLALHAAGYREVADRLGRGRFLDVGCGLGDGTAGFLEGDRAVVAVDYDAATARSALARLGRDGVTVACMDGARLGLRSTSFDWVCSSHLIEHFADPELHARELARVLRPGGTAFIITPNEPADFENPYHISLFRPPDLAALLRRHFGDVEVLGLDGTPDVKADFEERRRTGRRLLALDVFGLRHRLPRRFYVGLHALGRRVAYGLMRDKWSGGATGISASDFSITRTIDDSTLVLFAVARRT
jgi:SAM-dependent methyltransferase